MLTLYGNLDSGNVYKVRLLLTHLAISHRRIEVNQVDGHPRTPEFRAINPIGKVPAVRFDDGRVLSESGAILFFLARETPFWPADPWHRAQVLRWMFFEQYSHEPAIAVNRYILKFMDETDRRAHGARLAENAVKGEHALAVMESHLTEHRWFGAPGYSIADIALYAYSHVAEEGGFNLGRYPRIGDWLERVRAEPRHIRLREETSTTPPEPLITA